MSSGISDDLVGGLDETARGRSREPTHLTEVVGVPLSEITWRGDIGFLETSHGLEVSSGKLDVRIGATFPLAEAKAAHDALEGRQTTGKVLLKP